MMEYACDFRSLKFEPFSFSLISAWKIDHVSKFRDGSPFEFENSEIAQNSNRFCIEFNFSSKLSHLRIFELKKWAIAEFWHVIDFSSRTFRDSEWFEFWAISKSHTYSIMGSYIQSFTAFFEVEIGKFWWAIPNWLNCPQFQSRKSKNYMSSALI